MTTHHTINELSLIEFAYNSMLGVVSKLFLAFSAFVRQAARLIRQVSKSSISGPPATRETPRWVG